MTQFELTISIAVHLVKPDYIMLWSDEVKIKAADLDTLGCIAGRAGPSIELIGPKVVKKSKPEYDILDLSGD